MSSINAGILTNAFPLTSEQIKIVENRVLESKEAFVFLNENKEICYALPVTPEMIKELAWHNTYELVEENGVLIKKVYRKDSLDKFFLKDTLQKNSYEASWNTICNQISLLDEALLDSFILE